MIHHEVKGHVTERPYIQLSTFQIAYWSKTKPPFLPEKFKITKSIPRKQAEGRPTPPLLDGTFWGRDAGMGIIYRFPQLQNTGVRSYPRGSIPDHESGTDIRFGSAATITIPPGAGDMPCFIGQLGEHQRIAYN
jgi:hypothetical protein